MAWGVIWLWIWGHGGGGSCSVPPLAPGWAAPPLWGSLGQTHVHRDVDVVAVPRVDVHSVEAGAGTIDDLEPLPFLDCQVNQQRAVREVSKGLWRRVGVSWTGVGSLVAGHRAGAGLTLKAMNLW